MVNVTAADVMKLRQATNAGMMDCKHALQEAEGDFEKAVDIIRKKGLLIASKRADRDAKEGCVLGKTDGKNAVVVALNCETDFVAKNEGFIAFTTMILEKAMESLPANTEALLALEIDGRTIAAHISEKTGVIGEKIELGFYDKIEAEACSVYIHPGNRLVTAVGFNLAADARAMKNVAMQVAAMSPIAVDKNDVDQKTIDHELMIARDKAREEGKPEEMLDRIAQGRINKFFQEATLLNQVYEQDGKISVREYLHSIDKALTVTRFIRFGLA